MSLLRKNEGRRGRSTMTGRKGINEDWDRYQSVVKKAVVMDVHLVASLVVVMVVS